MIDAFVNDAFDVFIPAFVMVVLPLAMVVNDTFVKDALDTFIYPLDGIVILVNVAIEGYVIVEPQEINIPFVVFDGL